MSPFFVILVIIIIICFVLSLIALSRVSNLSITSTTGSTGSVGGTGSIGGTGPMGTTGFAGATGSIGATGGSYKLIEGVQTLPLISSVTGFAPVTNENMVATWGMVVDFESISGNSVDVWIACNGSNVQIGNIQRMNYSFDINTGATGVSPVILPTMTTELLVTGPTGTEGLSGIVVNYNPAAFIISGSLGTGAARVISVGEDGSIYAFNESVDPALITVITTTGADYKGCALLSNILYATNWNSGFTERYDSNFAFIDQFAGPDISLINVDGYAPYNVAVIKDKIFVSFAFSNGGSAPTIGLGNGFIDVFSPDGTFERRFSTSGYLNAPWGMIYVAAEFSDSGYEEVQIGNHGDGFVSRFLFDTGNFLAFITDQFGNPGILQQLYTILVLPFLPGQGLVSSSFFQEQEGLIAVGVRAPPLDPNNF